MPSTKRKSLAKAETSSALVSVPSKSARKPPQKWQLQTAKAKFSEVFRRARTEGPQWITRQGKEAVVIIPAEQFEELTGRSQQAGDIVDFFRNSPLMGLDLDLEREDDYGRDIEL